MNLLAQPAHRAHRGRKARKGLRVREEVRDQQAPWALQVREAQRGRKDHKDFKAS